MTFGANPAADRTIGTLLSNLSSEVLLLLGQELQLLKAEVRDNVSRQGRAAAMLAAGGGILFSGWLVLLASATLGLARVLAPWLAALIIAAVTLLVGYAVLRTGMRRLNAARLLPQRTLDSLREDAAWIKERLQ